jgi:hypothetical protein
MLDSQNSTEIFILINALKTTFLLNINWEVHVDEINYLDKQ